MANNGNKMVDSDKNCTEQIDDFSNIPNATDEGSSTSGNSKFFPKILKYLMRSTARIIQSKKKKLNARKRSVSTLRKSGEKITKCTSLSSVVNKIKSDAGTAVNIKKKMNDAVTSTTQLDKVFDKVTRENVLGVVGNPARDASHRYAKYTGKYVDNAVQKRNCGPLCIGSQSRTVDGEFGMKTSPAAFAKACEERRHADFILGKIAKISDALTEEKARLVSTKEQASSILTSISVTSMRFQVGEETFEKTKPLTSSIIHAEEKPITVTATTITVMQPETLTDTQALASSSDLTSESQISTGLDKSLSTDIRGISSLKHLRNTEPTTSVMYPERDDFQDTKVPRIKIEEEELPAKIPVSSTLDKHVVENDYDNSVIVNCIPKLKRTMSKCLDLYQPKNVQTKGSKRNITTAKDDVSESSLKKEKYESIKDKSEKDKPIKDKPKEDNKVDKRKINTIKDIFSKSVSFKYKEPRYRAKYRSNDAPVEIKKEDTISERIRVLSDKIPKYEYVSLPSKPKSIRTCRSFNYFERPMEMYQECHCRNKPLRCLQPIGHCENLISSNMCLGRPKCCDVWTVQCFNSQNDITRNAYCCPLQDSCATGYRASCHSLIDVPSRYYNINDCAKPRVTFGNSLYTNTYYKNDTKYYYPHLNNIDNVRMGCYHCNDSCPVWDNNQHCGRDRSYYWTKGNLYFTHPWTSEHLL